MHAWHPRDSYPAVDQFGYTTLTGWSGSIVWMLEGWLRYKAYAKNKGENELFIVNHVKYVVGSTKTIFKKSNDELDINKFRETHR